MRAIVSPSLLALVVGALCHHAAAQSSSAAPVPTTEAVMRAQQAAREAMSRLPGAAAAQEAYGGALPKIDAIPQPPVAAPDLASIAQKYQHLSKPQAPTSAQPDLLVLVSLSMPKQALERIIEQAERAGATLVFRGLKDGSMNRMGEELQKLIGQRNVSAAIHPPAFQQFSVTRVPAVVIAGAEAGEVLENGCARPETFVKVTGDVTLDYALDYIERKSPAWAAWAKHYRSKIVGGIR
ncbi:MULTISPECIES: type-F conjugative transfer system pilin assembly protein TrbC [unclassified Tepidimonas]